MLKYFNKLNIFIFLAVLFLFFTNLTLHAQSLKKVPVYLFFSESCPHCRDESKFLLALSAEIPEIEIHAFEVSANQANSTLLAQVAKNFQADSRYVPFTVIGNAHLVGYLNDATTGSQIKSLVDKCLREECPDVVGNIIQGTAPENQTANSRPEVPEKIHLPVIGDIYLKNLSLPILTIVIGALDGFNPCAMWVLMFLISLLIQMQNKKRMWILGSAFIASSAIIYFLFMAAWLNLFLFLGFIFWIRLIVGVVALASAGYNLREYWKNKNSICKVADSAKKQKIFHRLRVITQKEQLIIALAGIVLLAGAVNLVELICSAGLPAVYTQVLTLSQLPAWQYYFYIFLYIIIFMLDDLIVFVIAMITLKATGITTKYSRFSKLVGGIIMLIIGLLLLFRPGWLMFHY